MDQTQNDQAERTIVGGRPRKRGPGRAGIPRGIEVLIKKASLDPAFCRLLLEHRAAAAHEIELELTPSEAAILDAVPEAQLRAMIDRTTVPDAQRRAFLGTLGATMLAAVLAGCEPPTPDETPVAPAGTRPEWATATPTIIEVEKGIRPEDEITLQAQRTATFTAKATPTSEATATSTPNAVTGTRPEEEPAPPPPVVRGTRPDRP